MRIGLLGGSFNPPHAAHRAISLFTHETATARSRLVAGHARQSAQGYQRRCMNSASACRPRGDVANDPAHRGQLSRIRHPHALHYRHDQHLAPPLLGLALCLDHGRRQPRSIPSLAGLAADRCPGADRGDRSSAAKFFAPSPRPPPRRSRAIACPRMRQHCLQIGRAPAWTFLTGLKLNLSSTGLRNPDGSWKGYEVRRTCARPSGLSGILKPLTPHDVV